VRARRPDADLEQLENAGHRADGANSRAASLR
jgi:hypothetical protein